MMMLPQLVAAAKMPPVTIHRQLAGDSSTRTELDLDAQAHGLIDIHKMLVHDVQTPLVADDGLSVLV